MANGKQSKLDKAAFKGKGYGKKVNEKKVMLGKGKKAVYMGVDIKRQNVGMRKQLMELE